MKQKPQRNKRKKESHQKRYGGMTAKEWSNFKKTSTKEEVLAIRKRAKELLK